jgi:hypothetical protein
LPLFGAVALERAAELVEDAFGRLEVGAAQAVRGLVDPDRLLAVDRLVPGPVGIGPALAR